MEVLTDYNGSIESIEEKKKRLSDKETHLFVLNILIIIRKTI